MWPDHLPIQIQRRRGQRHLRLRVYPSLNKILVTAPFRIADRHVQKFILQNLDWIEEQWSKVQTLCAGESVLVFGESKALGFEASNRFGYQVMGDSLVLRAPDSKLTTYQGRRALLDRFYLDQLKKVALPKVLYWQGQMGVQVQKLSLRKMSSRWGSCSPLRGRICLNTELARYPLECLDYVIVHECAHFFELGHGPRFKAVLDKYLPQWRELEKQFKPI